MNSLQRRALLVELIKLRRPVATICDELSRHEWDSRELVELRATDVVEILDKYLAGRLSAPEIELWANALEGRDDVEYDREHERDVKDAIWKLANPAIAEALSPEQAAEMRKRLTD